MQTGEKYRCFRKTFSRSLPAILSYLRSAKAFTADQSILKFSSKLYLCRKSIVTISFLCTDIVPFKDTKLYFAKNKGVMSGSVALLLMSID